MESYKKSETKGVGDPLEGTAKVHLPPFETVSLSAAQASVLFGSKILGVSTPVEGKISFRPKGGGLEVLPVSEHDVRLTGEVTFEFQSPNSLIFCMTDPSKGFRQSFLGKRCVWSISKNNLGKFSDILFNQFGENTRPSTFFPFLRDISSGHAFGRIEHGKVNYEPRSVALANSTEGRLKSMIFTRSTFIKPKGPPDDFEKQEEYRFEIVVGTEGGSVKPHIPECLFLPLEPFRHLIRFETP